MWVSGDSQAVPDTDILRMLMQCEIHKTMRSIVFMLFAGVTKAVLRRQGKPQQVRRKRGSVLPDHPVPVPVPSQNKQLQ